MSLLLSIFTFLAGYALGRMPTRKEVRMLDLYMEQLKRMQEQEKEWEERNDRHSHGV